jgi:hypothetical protein
VEPRDSTGQTREEAMATAKMLAEARFVEALRPDGANNMSRPAMLAAYAHC